MRLADAMTGRVTIGFAVRAIREARGLSSGELAARIGVSKPRLSLLEHDHLGRRALSPILRTLAQVLEVPARLFFDAAGIEFASESSTERQRDLVARRRAEGLCIQCHSPAGPRSRSYCEEHRKAKLRRGVAYQRGMKPQPAGVCAMAGCQRSPWPNSVKCSRHILAAQGAK